jgi:putative transposase
MEQQSNCKIYKHKLKPTAIQERLLERTLMLGCQVYNAAIGERREAWRMRVASVSYLQQEAELPGITAAMPEYAEINARALQDVILRVVRAYHAFFRRIKAGETPGYPRFRGSNRYNSLTYPQVGQFCGARLDYGTLVLSRIGRIAVRWSRLIAGTPKTVTIRREADGWYACISCANAPKHPLPPTGQETGADMGLGAVSTPSDGTRIFHPGWYRKAERAFKMAQRQVARRRKGSSRRKRAVTVLAKAHLKVKRQRADCHHIVALQLVQTHDPIYPDDVQTANMVKNHHLAKSISDAGWSQFLTIRSFEAACAGRRVIAVDPACTSQTCSGCGVTVTKGVSVRWRSCPDCGTSLQRDQNAAKNREWLGQSRRGGVALATSENRESPAFMRGVSNRDQNAARNIERAGQALRGGVA